MFTFKKKKVELEFCILMNVIAQKSVFVEHWIGQDERPIFSRNSISTEIFLMLTGAV